MRLLLDTHALIWWDQGVGMREEATAAVRGADRVYVSAASAWEIAIKIALGRLQTSRRLEDVVTESGFEELPIGIVHAEAAGRLPPHHRDPFDRMLIAQAAVEGLVLVTRDRMFARYDIEVLEA